MMGVRCSRGFTLVEVLVALAIVSIALAAGMRALALSTQGAQALQARSLALQAVGNRLAELRLQGNLPPVGATSLPCAQGPLTFRCEQRVQNTVNAGFRLVTVRVVHEQGIVLAELSGLLSALP